jgi:hypothetical protein
LSHRLGGVFFIAKTPRRGIVPVEPAASARSLYRALSEHPGILPHRDPIREKLFRVASALARGVSSWSLRLPLDRGPGDMLARVAPGA